jgi:hypothetical protein
MAPHQAIVIDVENQLVAGERRLRACQLLGWTEIKARQLGELTEKELRLLELEENIRRKDLTEYEKSKAMVAYVETVREVAKEESEELFVESTNNSPKRGRPVQPDSTLQVSQRTGIPEPTIRAAETHVSTADTFPFMQSWPQYRVLEAKEHLEKLPEEEHQAVTELLSQPGIPVEKGINTRRNAINLMPMKGESLFYHTKTAPASAKNEAMEQVVQKDWHKLLKTVEEDFLIAQSMAEAIDSGTIVHSMFSTRVTIGDVQGGGAVSASLDGPIPQEDLKCWARNIRLSLLSSWILMTNQAIEVKYDKHHLEDTDLDRQAVRCVIYQMRCAFAHGSYDPRWQVSPGYQKSFTLSNLPSGPITLDFAQLNGQQLKPSQQGGWLKVFELLKYAQRFL